MSRPGIGMTYIAGLESQLAAVSDLLDVIEVEPQTFWLGAPHPLPGEAKPRHRIDEESIARIAAMPQAKLVHSVSVPVGSARSSGVDEVKLVADAARRLSAAWVSEHLAFNHAKGPDGTFATGFFLPPRQTPAGVRAVAKTIRQFADRMPAPFAFETAVNYLRPRPDELPDGQFIAAVAEQADCMILLDLHNIWTNERNGRQPVQDFLAALPLERVVELHVAGGFEMDGFWLDAHSGLVPPQVLELLCETLPRLPNVRALIFEMLPAYAVRLGIPALRRQLQELRIIWDGYLCDAELLPVYRPHAVLSRPISGPSPKEWEDTLGALSIGRKSDSRLGRELESDPGLQLYRSLVAETRAGTLAGALPCTTQYLLDRLGEASVRHLFGAFAAAHAPSLYGANEALAFTDYVLGQGLALPELGELVRAEQQVILRHLSA